MLRVNYCCLLCSFPELYKLVFPRSPSPPTARMLEVLLRAFSAPPKLYSHSCSTLPAVDIS